MSELPSFETETAGGNLSRRSLISAFAAASAGMAVSAAYGGSAEAAAPSGGTAPTAAPGPEPLVDRAFVRIREGLVHYRHVGVAGGKRSRGSRIPLYLAHAGPGSSRGMEGLMRRLGGSRVLLAPDTLGHGDSAPPDVAAPDVAYYADSVVRILDALDIEQIDYYGAHTGAHIGCELALRAPGRVRRLILDGVTVFPAEVREEYLERYAPPMLPDEFGRHLPWAWQFVRDMSSYFPHYRREVAYRLQNNVPSPESLHAGVLDVLKALKTYHLGYHAVFRHEIEKRLPLLSLPVMCMGRDSDPVTRYLDQAAALVPGVRKELVRRSDGVNAAAAVIEDFLGR
ncbi:alpha/beta fold hydrolase [Povalibacter sp.]|uniref:alpha/beta fold hydrolase n=1 Tax=Povalibacter sp. TaxID=1962978 RepID=UPI002F3F6458